MDSCDIGYGGTDKPVDLNAYRLKQMAAEVVDILDCLGVETVEAVGHDLYAFTLSFTRRSGSWFLSGSPLLSRMVNYFPSRLTSLTFMDIGYAAPPLAFNKAGIDSLNNLTLATLGYEVFGYWSFFNEEDSGKILNAHVRILLIYSTRALLTEFVGGIYLVYRLHRYTRSLEDRLGSYG